MEFRTQTDKADTYEILNSEYINWDYFKNSTIMITGATGLIGEQIVKSIFLANEVKSLDIKILALVRDKNKAKLKFNKAKNIKYIIQDIQDPVKYGGKVDYIIHTANSTSSRYFVENPVETVNSIVQGTNNILFFAKSKNIKSMVYLSSMEVYGETDFERIEPLKEEDYGYIDILNPRSSYPEGKRLAETLCHSFYGEYGLPVKTARLVQTIGAGVDYYDNRVFAQFARNVCEQKNIVLKTDGAAIRNYCYITDAVSAIFVLLERGENGACYNAANDNAVCSIKELAELLIKKYTNSKLEFQTDDKFYPPRSKLCVDISKLQSLNWSAKVGLEEMFDRLISNFGEVKRKYFNDKINQKKLKLIQKIFSVKNDKDIKIVRILGLNFRFSMNGDYDRYKKLPVQNNKIVFSNTKGKSGYGCNPKYIAEEIIKQGLPYELVWLVHTKRGNINLRDFPNNIRTVDYGNNKSALKELATAKLWVENQSKIYHCVRGLEKKENQFYIQCWHGSLGIKKIGKDSAADSYNDNEYYFKKDADFTDYLISNSTFEDNVYKKRFNKNSKILQYGHPRNDIFFKDVSAIKDKIYNLYGLDKTNKIILYAPTFRNGLSKNNVSCFDIDYERVINTFEKQTGETYVFLQRMHPETQGVNKIDDKKFRDVSAYSDMQELLAAADVLVSDYSCCMFDFMLSKKPCFIFAADIEKYDNERGFYYPLSSTPFPIARNNEELIRNIENFDNEKYRTEAEEFLKEKGCIEDGHASERVVELIKEIMDGISMS